MAGGYIVDDCTAYTDISQITVPSEVSIDSPCGKVDIIPTPVVTVIDTTINSNGAV